MEILKSIQVYGRVQGVFFRASTQKQAEKLGLKGWVKNEKDGSVSIEAEGSLDKMEEFIKWCHHGPVGARVDKVEVKDGTVKNYPSFEISK